MTKVAPIDQRKADHIKINLEQDVRSALTTGLENYRFHPRGIARTGLEPHRHNPQPVRQKIDIRPS